MKASRMRTFSHILQIFPIAPGWQAMYATPGGEPGIDYGSEPLVGWALVECGLSTTADNVQGVGMIEDNKVLEVAWSENFLGYSYPGCTIDWQQLALQYIAEHP